MRITLTWILLLLVAATPLAPAVGMAEVSHKYRFTVIRPAGTPGVCEKVDSQTSIAALLNSGKCVVEETSADWPFSRVSLACGNKLHVYANTLEACVIARSKFGR